MQCDICCAFCSWSVACGLWLQICLLGVHSLNMTLELDGSMVGWRGFLDSSSWNTELHGIREPYLVQYLMGVLTIQHINIPTSIETVVHECICGGNVLTNLSQLSLEALGVWLPPTLLSTRRGRAKSWHACANAYTMGIACASCQVLLHILV
jgi:hypothetical protein